MFLSGVDYGPHGHCRALSVLKPDHTVLGNVKKTSEGWEVDVNHCEIAR